MDVLFVCLGNICRSPAAEGVARGLKIRYPSLGRIDSAGIGGWHAGEPPHSTMRSVAREQGFPIDDLKARQVAAADFREFDWILAMDRENLEELRKLQARSGGKARVALLLDGAGLGHDEVPDPYYGGLDGFRFSFGLIEQGVTAFLDRELGIFTQ